MSAEPLVAAATALPTGRWLLLPETSTASFAVANFGFRTVTGTIPLREAASTSTPPAQWPMCTSSWPTGTGWRVDGRLSARGTSTPLTVAVAATEAEQAEIRATDVLDRRQLGIRAHGC